MPGKNNYYFILVSFGIKFSDVLRRRVYRINLINLYMNITKIMYVLNNV